MATIKPIEARTIHQIQSGQVIVDLCSVVKELVENSLDAEATTIDVRFKNQGLDSIEVQDNGSGISKENYETLALKHYTSKLSSYSDLGTLQTFGFRGEALSSLCALSKFTVTTCLAADAPKGSKLEFETSGKLCGTNVVAAQKGTTIAVEGLFRNLPVRRRELERNIKREWNKVIGVLNQYACIQTGVKFSVSQQPTKGKRMVLFSTKGNKTTRDNIVNVFGSKTLAVLIPLDLKLELEITSAPGKRLTQQEEGSTINEIRIQGHVSRPAHGEGRQTPDRQMFFVNARPCGLPQFAKVFNEVYKSYNASQSPFIFADIQLDTHLYDVNVSPDKRTILLHEQSRMLDNLRESLIALFESQDYAVPASQLAMPKYTPFKKPAFDRRDTGTPDSGKDSSALSGDDVRERSIPAGVEKHHAPEGGDDVEQPQVPPTTSLSVSTDSIAQDAQNLHLINRWAERKSDVRTDTTTVQAPRSDDGDTIQSKEGKLVTESTRDSVGGEEDQRQEDEDEGPDLSDAAAETEEPSHQVENFRARLEEIRNSQVQRSTDADTRSSQPAQPTSEPPIPAISTPSRKSDMRIAKVTPSRNLKRAAPEVATITIGNDTVTSVIGSPSKRLRSRSEEAPSSRSPQKQRAKESVPVPSFQGRLTQMFAAQSQPKSAKSADLEVETELVDFEKQSESSGEHLFVGEGEEEEGEEEDEEKVQEEDNATESEEERHQDEVNTQDGTEEENLEDIEQDQPSPGRLSDDEYVDDTAKEDQEDPKGSASPEPEEDQTEKVSEETQKRTQSFIKGGAKKKDATYALQQTVRIDEGRLRSALADHDGCLRASLSQSGSTGPSANRLDASDAEEKLSLKISKSDFEKMKIIGQFNLGFIIAVRPAEQQQRATTTTTTDDELFIIDQHATDEKYNFERLQASTVVQSQRLVQPKTLELTALEEEIIKENLPALEANGFAVAVDDSGDSPVGSRCQLLSLPLSRETTFTLADLEELISLLADHQSSHTNNTNGDGNGSGDGDGDGDGNAAMAVIPRPSKVRKMFAMRACRSSVMIGKALPVRQMERLVRHMGELDKPWNCPHGRPTMRHLCGLGAWDQAGWAEGDGFDGGGGGRRARTDWAAYLRGDED